MKKHKERRATHLNKEITHKEQHKDIHEQMHQGMKT